MADGTAGIEADDAIRVPMVLVASVEPSVSLELAA